MSLQLRVGDLWAYEIAGWGELTYSHAADGGCKAASWRMDLTPTYLHPMLRRGQLVEIFCGPSRLWVGVLTEPDMADSWTFNAVGLSMLGADYLCLDGSGNSTSTPNTAIDQAIIRGLPWQRVPARFSVSLPFTAGDGTESIGYVGALLDAWADSNGKRWGVDADGVLYSVADPTVPTWHATPGSGRFGLADDNYASDLYIRYTSSGGFATATDGDPAARLQFGRKEFPVDATSRGLLTAAQAKAVATGLLAKGRAQLGWTNSLELSAYQLTTPGGIPAFLPAVKAGDLVRMFGVLNEQGQPLHYVDWVIGETSYAAGAKSINLAPVGLADRTLLDVLTA